MFSLVQNAAYYVGTTTTNGKSMIRFIDEYYLVIHDLDQCEGPFYTYMYMYVGRNGSFSFINHVLLSPGLQKCVSLCILVEEADNVSDP